MSDQRIRVVHGHMKKAHRHFMFYPGRWRENPDVVYLDAVGRRNSWGEPHAWIPLICAIRDECPAKVLIRRDLIEGMADEALREAFGE